MLFCANFSGRDDAFACGIAWIYLRPAVQSLVSVPGLPEPTETRGPRPTDSNGLHLLLTEPFLRPILSWQTNWQVRLALAHIPVPDSLRRRMILAPMRPIWQCTLVIWQFLVDTNGKSICYHWETRFQNVEEFYTSRFRLSGYDMTFMDQGLNEVYLIKYKHGLNRIAIQFNGGSSPSLLLFRWVG